MELWWPRAAKDVGEGAGRYTEGKFKGVLHTTEGKNYAGARSAYVKHNSWPHFTVSFEGGSFQAWQHVALNVAARSLKHPPATVQTNRARVVQIEIVGSAAKAAAMPEPYLIAIADLMRWIETQTGIQRTAPSFMPYPDSSGLDNGIRMKPSDWLKFAGWCGHQHVPNNSHGDPGAIDIGKLLSL